MDNLVDEFFVELIETPRARSQSINLDALDLPVVDLSALEDDFNEEEIWNVIKVLPPDKVSGPYGMLARFYQHCWSVIKGDVMVAIRQISRADDMSFEKINRAYLTLIPKKY